MINYRREAQRIVCQGLRATLADVPYVLTSEIEAGYLDEVLLEQARLLARANARLRSRNSAYVPEAEGPWELELPNVRSMRDVRERVVCALEVLCEAEDMNDELLEKIRGICNELRDFSWPLR